MSVELEESAKKPVEDEPEWVNVRSMPTHVTYNWTDITDEFFRACSVLKLGELLQDQSFGLFEAMSAIEMMDPKMDVGMQGKKPDRPVLGFDDSLTQGLLKVNDLEMSELIGVMDTIVSCLVTWMEGHSLAQTLFTCLYLHKPLLIEDRCLKAYCVATVKLCEIIHDTITHAGVYEEEDFQPLTYGFSLTLPITQPRVLGMLREAEDDLSRKLKQLRQLSGPVPPGVESPPAETRDRDGKIEETQAALNRFKLLRMLFVAVTNLSKRDLSNSVGDILKCLTQATDLIGPICATIGSGVQPAESADEFPIVMGFEPLVNQRLLPPTFPRYTKIHTRDDAYRYIEALIGRLELVCMVQSHSQQFHLLVDLFIDFSITSPCVLSRSFLQSLVIPDKLPGKLFGRLPFTEIIKDSVRNFTLPPYVNLKHPSSNVAQARESVELFLSHSAPIFHDLLQIYGHNRARQREKLGIILETFSNVQEEAEKLDATQHLYLQKCDSTVRHFNYFGSWVLYHVLRVMIQYLLLGFELELYSPHEFLYVYWYLYEFSYNWLLTTLTRIETVYNEQESLTDQQRGKSAKKSKKKKRQRLPQRESIMTQAYYHMCGGFYKAILGFTLAGKFRRPLPDFDSEEIRFEHRFAPFMHIYSPPPVPYSQFVEMTNIAKVNPKLTAEDFYNSASKAFQQSKAMFESMNISNPEMNSLIRVAKTNFVVMKLMTGGHMKDSTKPPIYDFSAHRNFPIIKIS